MEDEKNEESKQQSKTNTMDQANVVNDDLVMEIVQRLPIKPIHRFKCVSRSCRDLIDDPIHRKKLPQTLAGFFYGTCDTTKTRGYADISYHYMRVPLGGAAPQINTSFPFLPKNRELKEVEDICRGLLLCRCTKSITPSSSTAVEGLCYIVCNPATEKWVELPPQPTPRSNESWRKSVFTTRLAFDPLISSHFYVFEFENEQQGVYMTGVNIYSSQTGAWNYRQNMLDQEIFLCLGINSAFANGKLHILGMLPTTTGFKVVLVVLDTEGQVWDIIHIPEPRGIGVGSVGLSQGSLLYANIIPPPRNEEGNNTMSVWRLDDYLTKRWVQKRSVSFGELFERTGKEYRLTVIHPDCDIMFLVSWGNAMLVYFNMQSGEFHGINLEKHFRRPLLPYVPLFSGSLASEDGH